MCRPSDELLLCVLPLADLPTSLEQSGGLVAYGAMVPALFLGTLGVPVPEDAVLVTSGALAAAGQISWPVAFAVAWGTILLLDVALHGVGRWAGPRLRRSRLGAASRGPAGAPYDGSLRSAGSMPSVRRRSRWGFGFPPSSWPCRGSRLEAVVDAPLAARWVLLAAAIIAVLLLWRYARGRRENGRRDG